MDPASKNKDMLLILAERMMTKAETEGKILNFECTVCIIIF